MIGFSRHSPPFGTSFLIKDNAANDDYYYSLFHFWYYESRQNIFSPFPCTNKRKEGKLVFFSFQSGTHPKVEKKKLWIRTEKNNHRQLQID